MNLQPLGDRVIIKVDDHKKQTDGGILLPDQAQERSQTGVIVAVGPGDYSEAGTLLPIRGIEVGDRVWFRAYPVDPIPDTDGGMLSMPSANVIAKIVGDKPRSDVWTEDAKADPKDAAPAKRPELGVVQHEPNLPGNHPLAQKSDSEESLRQYAKRMAGS